MGTDGNNGGPHSCYGRYWINGYITSGKIDIAVNGVRIGTFSSHVDQEISQWCRKGDNTITFTHHPDPGEGAISSAHLQLFDGLRSSSPLEFTYDTTVAASEAQESASSSADTVTYPGSGPAQPTLAPSDSSLSSSDDSDDALTDYRDFEDTPDSSGVPAGSQTGNQ
jgi:hypothetical protein